MKPYVRWVAMVISTALLLSNSNGPGLVQRTDFTRSPVSLRSCNNCHIGGDFQPHPTMTMTYDGATITTYEPGKTYELQIHLTSENIPSAYGFQLVGMTPDFQQAGSWGDAPLHTHMVTINNRGYWEHSQPLTDTQYAIEWTAPSSAEDTMQFYMVANAVNGNGATSGDDIGFYQMSLAPDPGSATSTVNHKRSLCYPSPATDLLYFNQAYRASEKYIYSSSGRLFYDGSDAEVDLTTWPIDIYYLIIQDHGSQYSERFMKIE